MIDTDNYRRFERVDDVEETAHRAARADARRAAADRRRPRGRRPGQDQQGRGLRRGTDVRGLRRPAGGARRVLRRAEDGVVRLRTSAMVVSLWLDPLRLDVHRTDGSAGGGDRAGRAGPLLGLRHAERRLHAPPAVPARGRHLRARREVRPPEPQGPRLHAVEHRRARPRRDRGVHRRRDPSDPRADRTSTEFDPYYVSIPFFYHQAYPAGAMAGSFVDNGYRGELRVLRPQEYRIHFAGGQYTEYIFAGPGDARDPRRPTPGSPGARALPPLWSLGYHQCRWFDYTQDAVEALAQRHRDARHPLRRAVARHRVHGRLPRLHLEHRALPRRRRACSSGCREQGFRVDHDHRSRREVRPGYWVFDQALERDVLCRTEGGDIYIGQVWPGNTAFPDFVTEEARAWWGELNAAHVAVRAGRDLERHERAGDREHPARARCASARGRTPTSATTTSTRC